jgi:hypothetical protein
MNPLTRLYRASRVFRVTLYLLMFPLWVLVFLISVGALDKYTEVGDLTLLLSITLFALWAWWYDEDRDRRRVAHAAAENGEVGPRQGDVS